MAAFKNTLYTNKNLDFIPIPRKYILKEYNILIYEYS